MNQKLYKRKFQRKPRYVPLPNLDTRLIYLKCNKLGHIVKYYKFNKKLTNLELDDGVLIQISNLLVETSSNEEGESTEVELENNQMVQENNCYSFKSSKTWSFKKEVNVLTKEHDLLFKVICHLPDDEQKKSYL